MALEYDSVVPELRGCTNCGQTLGGGDRFCPGCGAAVTGKAVDPLTGEPMGFWVRVVAWVIDMVISGVLQGTAAAIFVPLFGIWGLVSVNLISPLYFVLFTAFRGQTLGKMAMRIKIVNARGETPGIWRALLRETIGKLISSIFFLLGYFWVGWDSRKRAWHDHLAGTYPVRAPSKDPDDSIDLD